MQKSNSIDSTVERKPELRAVTHDAVQPYFEALAVICEQRDELLAIAKTALKHLDAWHTGEFEAEKAQARAAIAKVESNLTD